MKTNYACFLAGLLSLPLAFLSGRAQDLPPGTLQDAGLEAAIRQTLSKPTGPLTTNDLVNILSLPASNRGITNLAGLQVATNLHTLILDNNGVSDLVPLAGLTHLTVLKLGGNAISNLSPLSARTTLEELDLSNNRLTDAAALGGLTNLYSLTLHYNAITDFQWLSGLTRLRELTTIELRDAAALAGLTNLVNLTVRGVTTHVETVSTLTHLQSLDLSGSPLGDASALSGLTRLKVLLLGDCALTDLSALTNLTGLESLRLDHNPVVDFSPLARLGNLAELWMAGVNLRDLSVLGGLSKLERLDLSFNPLGDLAPLAGLTNLTVLILTDAGLTDVSVVGFLPMLQNLHVDNNQLGDLTSLAGLQWPYYFELSAQNNALTNITTLLSVPHLDYAYLLGNRLDLGPQSPVLDAIHILQSRGAFVEYGTGLQTPVLIASGSLGPAVLLGDQVRFSFYTQPGVAYDVEYSESAFDPQWQTLTTLLGDGGLATFYDSMTGHGRRFYRLLIP